ncbi:hypothetical protein BD309DRAFT_330204 [Dichomitus squalens]|nr:hypothetical protein BD309DRAFT_330204 [Dichomitus squalens]
MNFRRLSQLPLCHLVTELRVVWGLDMFQVDQIPLLQGLLAPHLTPETLPRIRSLVVTSLGADATAYLTAIGPKTFTPLRSLRSLTLSHTVHRNFQDIQLLICSFPYLDCLRLNGTWWNDDDIDSRTSLAASSASFAERLATLGDLTSLYAPPGAVARELPVGARSPASYDPASKWECFSASPLIRAVCEAVECPNKRITE